MDRSSSRMRPAAAWWWLAACFLMLQCQTPPPPEEPPAAEPETVVVAGEKFQVRIALDELGVLAVDGTAAERAKADGARLGLALEEVYRGGVYVFRLEERESRNDLRRFARQLTEQTDWIELAGLVVRPEGERDPLVLTDEVIVQFDPDADEQRAQELFQAEGLAVVSRNPFVREQYLVVLDGGDERDGLAAAAELHERPEVVLAQPNFVRIVELRQWVPNDPRFVDQWHHQNTGQGGGTVDADIDAPLAWALSTGGAGTVIAVIDDGFDTAHADLAPNAWTNTGEIPGNGTDDDGNGFIDDTLGWDFRGGDAAPTPGAGDDHGTAVAGCAAARGDNGIGVSGSCPACGLMFIRNGATLNNQALGFDYARAMGADVITNSWGYALGPGTQVVQNAINNAANNGRGGLGCVVLFAMRNGDVDDCIGVPDISSMANVIAVSAASNQDRKVTESAWGVCMDVLGPTHRGYNQGTPVTGTLNVVTTDRTGNPGYNSNSPIANCPSIEPSAPPNDARSYTYCFGGTSAATPISAGICGLLLDLDPGLTRLQVQRLLQDTCDKIEDSLGAYALTTGMSAPAGGVPTHGYGRVNAFEAARTVAPAARGGQDAFLRDNRLDWGNTEQPSNVVFEPTRGFLAHWQSVDVKVDAPPFGAAPTTSQAFDALVHEQPIAQTTNRVYVRVHNRGPDPATNVTVKLHWVFAGTALPALPTDFWSAFPADSADPTNPYNTIGTQTVASLAYSGASVAGGAQDASAVLQFDFAAPAVPTGQASPRHHCLFAVLDSPADPISDLAKGSLVTDFVTPRDNNVTHRNVQLQDPAANGGRLEEVLMIRNPYREPIRASLEVSLPKGWEIDLDGPAIGSAFPLKAGEELPVRVRIEVHGEQREGEVTVVQRRLDTRPAEVTGGFTFRFASREP